MSNHTPAPWSYDVESQSVFYDDGDVCPTIAYLDDNAAPDRNCEDGLLIAAAPELLAALRAISSKARELASDKMQAGRGLWSACADEADAAIAKTRG